MIGRFRVYALINHQVQILGHFFFHIKYMYLEQSTIYLLRFVHFWSVQLQFIVIRASKTINTFTIKFL